LAAAVLGWLLWPGEPAARAETGDPATLPQGLAVTDSIGITLRHVPSGEFVMGAPETEIGSRPEERPPHPVRITHAFYLGVHEVTQDQFRAVIGSNPSNFSQATPGGQGVAWEDTGSRPVENVSWYDAVAFCNRLRE